MASEKVPKQPKPKLTSSFELFPKSYQVVKKNIGTLLVLGLLLVLMLLLFISPMIILSFVASSSTATAQSSVSIFNVISIIIGIFVVLLGSIFLGVTYQAALLQMAQGKKITVRSAWDQAKPKVVDVFLATVLSGLLVVGGLILFIVPGLIMFRRYYLVSFFVLDKDLKPLEAMRQSAAASKKVSGYIWGILGVSFLLQLSGLIPFIGGIVSAVLGFIYAVAPALRYEEIKDLA